MRSMEYARKGQIHRGCGACGKGDLVCEDRDTEQSFFMHKCNCCDARTTFPKAYPYDIEIDYRISWDEYFMILAKTVAIKSKDPSKRIGAVVVGADHQIVSTGFNGFPRGVKDGQSMKERLTNRDEKLKFTAHAEANAVYQAARHGICLKGCTLYVSSLPPCAACAQAIIQAGITSLVVDLAALPVPDRWKDSVDAAMQMFTEAGIEYRTVSLSVDTEDLWKKILPE